MEDSFYIAHKAAGTNFHLRGKISINVILSSKYLCTPITNCTNPILYCHLCGSVVECICLPQDWEIVGSNPDRIIEVIYCQSPC